MGWLKEIKDRLWSLEKSWHRIHEQDLKMRALALELGYVWDSGPHNVATTGRWVKVAKEKK